MNKLYSNILYSINREIKEIIKEQFNISDIDFNDVEQEHGNNIFNKEIVDPEYIYNNILYGIKVSEFEIGELNSMRSAVECNDKSELTTIIQFYSKYYPADSLNWIDVSNITNMQYLFSGNIKNKLKYNGDISQWNVHNVTVMNSMFMFSIFNNDISGWDVSNVKDMGYMFARSEFNGDISHWNVSNVNDMKAMFNNSKFNRDLSLWNVSNVSDMSYMFNRSIFNQDISSWDVSNVTDMKYMFNESVFNQDISSWDVSNVQHMDSMFYHSKFNQNISNWDVSNVDQMYSVFTRCPIKNSYKPRK